MNKPNNDVKIFSKKLTYIKILKKNLILQKNRLSPLSVLTFQAEV